MAAVTMTAAEMAALVAEAVRQALASPAPRGEGEEGGEEHEVKEAEAGEDFLT